MRELREKLSFSPVTKAKWKDFETLFGKRGACGGCWCTYWRLPHSKFISGKKSGFNKRYIKKIIEGNKTPGIIAYHDETPVGWCSIAPRDEFTALERSRALKKIDDKPVWSISCLFILKGYRRIGISTKLIKEACKWAAKKKAKIVEAYPFDVKKNQPDPFIWTGTPKSYLKAGFKEIIRNSKTRPIMRKTVSGIK